MPPVSKGKQTGASKPTVNQPADQRCHQDEKHLFTGSGYQGKLEDQEGADHYGPQQRPATRRSQGAGKPSGLEAYEVQEFLPSDDHQDPPGLSAATLTIQ
jgi:hypothetical protein